MKNIITSLREDGGIVLESSNKAQNYYPLISMEIRG